MFLLLLQHFPFSPQTVELKAMCKMSAYWRQISERVRWWFDCSAATAPTEDRSEQELCTVSPSSGSLGPSQSICLTVSIRPGAIRAGEKWLMIHTHYDGSLSLSVLPLCIVNILSHTSSDHNFTIYITCSFLLHICQGGNWITNSLSHSLIERISVTSR